MQSKESLEAHLTEHFRLSGVYWGLTTLYLMGQLDAVDGKAILEWVRSVFTDAFGLLCPEGQCPIRSGCICFCRS